MCAVSAIGDDWNHRRFPQHFPTIPSFIGITKEQLDKAIAEMKEELREELRADLQKLVQDLRVAKAEDEANGEPDCEMDEKVDLLKKFGEIFDIDFEEIFGKHAR